MTKAQERKIATLKKLAEENLFYSKNEYEFKRFDVKAIDGCNTVSVVIETGLVGDEGTAAQYYAREYGMFFVGPKGGIHYYSKKGIRKSMKVFYSAIYEQKYSD